MGIIRMRGVCVLFFSRPTNARVCSLVFRVLPVKVLTRDRALCQAECAASFEVDACSRRTATEATRYDLVAASPSSRKRKGLCDSACLRVSAQRCLTTAAAS